MPSFGKFAKHQLNLNFYSCKYHSSLSGTILYFWYTRHSKIDDYSSYWPWPQLLNLSDLLGIGLKPSHCITSTCLTSLMGMVNPCHCTASHSKWLLVSSVIISLILFGAIRWQLFTLVTIHDHFQYHQHRTLNELWQ